MRAIVVCTAPFQSMAQLESASLGVPELQLAILEHPLFGLDEHELERAVDGMEEIFERRFGGHGR